jgi:hypothetical protein
LTGGYATIGPFRSPRPKILNLDCDVVSQSQFLPRERDSRALSKKALAVVLLLSNKANGDLARVSRIRRDADFEIVLACAAVAHDTKSQFAIFVPKVQHRLRLLCRGLDNADCARCDERKTS